MDPVALENTSSAVLSFLGKQTVYSTILFAVVLIVTRLLRRAPAPVHLGLWSLVIIRLVLPPDFSLPFSGRNVLALLWDRPTVEMLQSPPPAEIAVPASIVVQSDQNQDTPNVSGTPSSVPTPPPLPWKTSLILGWMAFVLALSFLYVKRLLRYHRIVREARPLDHPEMAAVLARWKKTFRIRRPVLLVGSDRILSPYTVGLFRPKVYIPQAVLSSKNPSLAETVLSHELAHVKQWDTFWIHAQNVVQILYFFHPVAWIAGNRIRLFRECLCDGLVLSKRNSDAQSYGRGLIAFLKMNLGHDEAFQGIPAFALKPNSMVYRIKEIASGKTAGFRSVLAAVCLMALLGWAVLPMAAGEKPPKDSGKETGSSLFIDGSQDRIGPKLYNLERAPTLPLDSTLQFGSLIVDDTTGDDVWLVQRKDRKTFVMWTNDSMKTQGLPVYLKNQIQFEDVVRKTERGIEVLSIADGKNTHIEHASPDSGYTVTVQIKPNGFSLKYMNLDSVYVHEGQTLKKGEWIGLMTKKKGAKLGFWNIQKMSRETKKDSCFVSPVPEGRLSAGFGPMKDPFSGKTVIHRGVDLKAPLGTPVLAAAGGDVLTAETTIDPGRGRYIIINHGKGYSTVYTHLDTVLVKPGQKVVGGETIGKVGTTGKSTGPHLHFEILSGERPEDPELYITFVK